MDAIRRRVTVRGTVQGVGFRMNARAQAVRLGLSGWAVNRDDGTVDVEIEGAPAAVEAMVDWLRIGPRYAEVTSVSVRESPPRGDSGFEVR
jgi:acylphosphatase